MSGKLIAITNEGRAIWLSRLWMQDWQWEQHNVVTVCFGIIWWFRGSFTISLSHLPTLMLHSKQSKNKHQEDIEENWRSSSRTTCGGPALVYWQLRAIVLDLFFGCCGVTENKIVLIILGIVHGKLNQRICIGTRSWTVNSITINFEIKQETQPWSWR